MKIILLMWPDTFEDWYPPHGVSRDSFLRGYDGEWTISFAQALGTAGHDVHILFGSRAETASERQEPSGAEVHFVRAPIVYRAFLHATWGRHRIPGFHRLWGAAPVAAALSPGLLHRIRSLGPDAILIQDYESLRYDILAPLLRISGTRIVGLDTGGSARPSGAPWKRLTRAMAHELMAANEPERARLGLAGHANTTVWPAPVRTDVFRPADRCAARRELGVGRQERVVFSAGRLHAVKNLPLMADACADAGATLVLAGEGPERGVLEGRPEVRLLGRQPPPIVARWYAACDVAALASNQEGQPVAVLEALACGRAVVATSVGGLEQLVGEARTGWLVPPRDRSAFAGALAEALADPMGADQRGTRGRDVVEANHSLAAVGRWITERLTT